MKYIQPISERDRSVYEVKTSFLQVIFPFPGNLSCIRWEKPTCLSEGCCELGWQAAVLIPSGP